MNNEVREKPRTNGIEIVFPFIVLPIVLWIFHIHVVACDGQEIGKWYEVTTWGEEICFPNSDVYEKMGEQTLPARSEPLDLEELFYESDDVRYHSRGMWRWFKIDTVPSSPVRTFVAARLKVDAVYGTNGWARNMAYTPCVSTMYDIADMIMANRSGLGLFDIGGRLNIFLVRRKGGDIYPVIVSRGDGKWNVWTPHTMLGPNVPAESTMFCKKT